MSAHRASIALFLICAACGNDSPSSDTSGSSDSSDTSDSSDSSDSSDTSDSADSADSTDSSDDRPIDEPDCAAVSDARCFYVAVDGNDSGSGDIDAPFKTFHAALVQAGPGDFIYARGGTYGLDNSVVASTTRLPQDSFPPPCEDGLVEADGFCQVGRHSFASVGDWDGYPMPNQSDFSYAVADGEPDRPITLRNFPGELPILDTNTLYDRGQEIEDAVTSTQSQRSAVSFRRSHWVLQGFEIIGGSVTAGGNIEDLTIEGCDIHDLTIHGGDNPGLIRLNRGPEDVHIVDNTLHDLYDLDKPGDWESVPDAQHFGAVTTLSGETYGGNDDTGSIEIRGNTIYHVPQSFFFKNAAAGPILIEDNHIYDSGRIASNVTANVSFVRNLVHNVRDGFWRQGQGFPETTLPPDELKLVLGRDGHNLRVEYNTIVGLEGTLMGLAHGVGHVFGNNVIMGLTGTAASSGYDDPSFIKVGDDVDIEATITSDNNCFVVSDAGFQMVAVYPDNDPLEHYDLSQVQAMFNMDGSSTTIVSTDATQVFVDPENGDYALSGTDCQNAGHLAP